MTTITPLSTLISRALGCALLAGASVAYAALPPTAAGAPDPTFNGGAPLYQPMSPHTDFTAAVLPQGDGGVLLVGFGERAGSTAMSGYVSRYRVEGALDPAFASGGTIRFGTPTYTQSTNAAALVAGGRILVGGGMTTGDPANPDYKAWAGRLNADGTIDTTFANQGELRPDCAPRGQCYYASLAGLPDGRFVAAGAVFDKPYDNLRPIVDRFNADGTPDTSFGTGGRVMLPASLAGAEPYHLVVDASGRYVIAGRVDVGTPSHNEAVLLRVTADGALDPAFGSAGVVQTMIGGLSSEFRRFALQADGRIVVASATYDPRLSGPRSAGQVVRFNADGTPDTNFGVQGVAAVGFGYGNTAAVQSDGRIVFAGQGYDAKLNDYVAMAARLMPDGRLDTGFGAGGFVYPYGRTAYGTLTSVSIAADDRMTVAGYTKQAGYFHGFIGRLIGTETTTAVTEFYNATLGHYFITADPAEAAAIDNGAAGPGWSRTGAAWKSGGPNRVCRFYGSPALDPATGLRRGPNGHFYTISSDECALVKQDAGWQFESYDFSGWPKQADGSCAAGTVAVKRAYNNRYAQNDSNHRYTTSEATYDAMLAQGWSGEGTVFCAPL